MSYTVRIIKQEILEQHEFMVLTVQLTSSVKLPDPVIDPGREKKLDAEGKEKKDNKVKKDKFPTKEIIMKFLINATFEQVKAEIKARVEAIEAAERIDLHLNQDLDLSTP